MKRTSWSFFLLGSLFALTAGTQPIIRYVDNVREKWQPTGATAWLKTGSFHLDETITATDITADGKILFIGDNNGRITAFDIFAQKKLWTQTVIAEGAAVKYLKADPKGATVLAAKQHGQNDFSHLYMVQNQGTSAIVTDMGVQEPYNPACSETKMDPTALDWSADGNTFFVLYEPHALANRGACKVAYEVYVWFNNLKTGATGVQNVILTQFSRPEEDEPDKIWCMRPVRMTAGRDNKTLAVSSCNARVALWQVAGNKMQLKALSKSVLYDLRAQGYDPVGGTGFMAFTRRGEIYFGMGEPGVMSKSAVVLLSHDLKKISLVAYFHTPYPRLILDPTEKYLFAGTDNAAIFDLKGSRLVEWTNLRDSNGHMAQLVSTKRIFIIPEYKSLNFWVEREQRTLTTAADWQSTGLYVRPGDSLWLGGNDRARVNAGFGDWLREDYKYGNSWLDSITGEVPEELKNSANEFKLRAANEPATFRIYGGRKANERTNRELLGAQPAW